MPASSAACASWRVRSRRLQVTRDRPAGLGRVRSVATEQQQRFSAPCWVNVSRYGAASVPFSYLQAVRFLLLGSCERQAGGASWYAPLVETGGHWQPRCWLS